MNTIVRIVVEATRSPAGRLTGSVTAPEGEELSFSGTLELLACIETVIDSHRPHHPDHPANT